MVSLEEFLKEEISETTKLLIYEGIFIERSKLDLIFNKYSIEVVFAENLVVIYDDVFEEDTPLKLKISEFLHAIKNK